MEWFIYIPEEGDWPIDYDGDNLYAAKAAYLKWAGRKRLPAGSVIWSEGHHYRLTTKGTRANRVNT
jgi:hypothetical protein